MLRLIDILGLVSECRVKYPRIRRNKRMALIAAYSLVSSSSHYHVARSRSFSTSRTCHIFAGRWYGKLATSSYVTILSKHFIVCIWFSILFGCIYSYFDTLTYRDHHNVIPLVQFPLFLSYIPLEHSRGTESRAIQIES